MRIALTVALASMVFASAANAQTRYSLGSDTLRFLEVTNGITRLFAPQGEFVVTTEHAATVALTRTSPDTARAWYEALVLGAESSVGNQRPSTDGVLQKPFVLGWNDRGRITLISAPVFPASFAALSDLTRQFDDFLPRLPEQTLAIGVAWTDTMSRSDSTAEKSSRAQTIASYRVDRDTTVDGQPAFIVSMKQAVSRRDEGPVPNQPMRADSQFSGTDEGWFVFAPKAGRLLARRREGKLSGVIVMRANGQELSVKQESTYSNSLDAVR